MLREGSAKVSVVAALGGLLLLVSLFLPWAQIVCEMEPCQYPSGWEVLAVLDVPLAILAVAAIVLGLVALPKPLPATGIGLALAGGAAVVLIFVAPLAEDASARPVDFGGSYFLGLFGAFVALVAGLTAYFMARESGDDEEGGDEEPGEEEGASEQG